MPVWHCTIIFVLLQDRTIPLIQTLCLHGRAAICIIWAVRELDIAQNAIAFVSQIRGGVHDIEACLSFPRITVMDEGNKILVAVITATSWLKSVHHNCISAAIPVEIHLR